MELAERNPGVKIHFNERCSGIDFKNSEINFHNELTGETTLVKSDIVIATDGATSAVRMEMQKIPRFNFAQHYENYGYKELIIPSGEDGSFLMEKMRFTSGQEDHLCLLLCRILTEAIHAHYFWLMIIHLEKKTVSNILIQKKEPILFQKQFPDAYKMIPEFKRFLIIRQEH